MEKNKKDHHSFHTAMLETYRLFIQKIAQEPFDLAAFADSAKKIEEAPVSEKEKHLHMAVLEEIKAVGKKLDNLEWMSQHLKILHDLQQTFTHTFDKEMIYQKAFELVSRVMDTDAFFIAFYREGDEEIYVPFSMDNGVQYKSRTMPFGEGITSQVLMTAHRYAKYYGNKQKKKKREQPENKLSPPYRLTFFQRDHSLFFE